MNKPKETIPSPKPHLLVRLLLHIGRIEYAAVMIILVLLVSMILCSHACYRHRHTCAICRLERIDYDWKYKLPTSTFNETACSKWYSSDSKATHQHVWIHSPSTGEIDFLGNVIGVSDSWNRPGRAIWRLTPEQQITVYKNFPNRQDATVLFISLINPKMMKDRYDMTIIFSLRDWVEAGCVKEWEPPEIISIPE